MVLFWTVSSLTYHSCMGKYKLVEFQFDWEIEKTARRLRREQRNSKTAIVMNDLQNLGNLDPHGPIQPVNV